MLTRKEMILVADTAATYVCQCETDWVSESCPLPPEKRGQLLYVLNLPKPQQQRYG